MTPTTPEGWKELSELLAEDQVHRGAMTELRRRGVDDKAFLEWAAETAASTLVPMVAEIVVQDGVSPQEAAAAVIASAMFAGLELGLFMVREGRIDA